MSTTETVPVNFEVAQQRLIDELTTEIKLLRLRVADQRQRMSEARAKLNQLARNPCPSVTAIKLIAEGLQ